MDDTKYWVWLSMSFTASGRIWELMCIYEDAAEAYYDLMSSSPAVELSQKEKVDMNAYTLAQVEQIIDKNISKGIGILTYSSPEYPDKLRLIANPPPVLYYKGNTDCLSCDRTVTSVGTRHPSPYSANAARHICNELAGKGIIIASGFAVGIDITSHLAAVSNGMPTICVLGCGIDINYPADNFKYRDRIIEAGGLFISEYQYNSGVRNSNFPKRNRILSALSPVTMMFQGTVSSGAVITASFAAEQGKEVFCLPPADIFSNAYSGNIKLLQDGALQLFSAEDVLSCIDYSTIPVECTIKTERPCTDENTEKTGISHEEEVQDSAVIAENTDDTPLQDRILCLLHEEPMHADIISQKLDIDSTDVLTELTELELSGAVVSMPGKMFDIKR